MVASHACHLADQGSGHSVGKHAQCLYERVSGGFGSSVPLKGDFAVYGRASARGDKLAGREKYAADVLLKCVRCSAKSHGPVGGCSRAQVLETPARRLPSYAGQKGVRSRLPLRAIENGKHDGDSPRWGGRVTSGAALTHQTPVPRPSAGASEEGRGWT